MTEMESLLIQAREEIRRLRRENEILHAKVSTMELFATVLNTEPWSPRQGMGEDIAWKLDKKATELAEEAKRLPVAAE